MFSFIGSIEPCHKTDTPAEVAYRRPIQVGLKWRKAGEAAWTSGVSRDLSNHGLSFEADADVVSGDSIEMALDAASTGLGNDISMSGRVVVVRPAKRKAGRQVGVALSGFATDDDANRYYSLIHRPEELLRREPLQVEP